MDLQTFFDSLWGQLTVVAVIVLLFGVILYSGKGKPVETKTLAVSALLVALAIILNQLIIFRMPQGGSITAFSMVPIVLCAYFFGVRRGLMAGMCVGLIDLIFNPYVIHPIQLLLDYPMAFGALAFGGIFAARKNGLIKGYIFGVICRYICAVLSGVIFFGAYAPEGFSALTWSVWYNLTYLAVEGAISVVLLAIPQIKAMFERLKVQVNGPGKSKPGADSVTDREGEANGAAGAGTKE
ncbi:MAG: energy-coupled thiamine transporter ThiT [Bacillota bacterium]|nr:energy-coupled thiamine transporter ThiT [Bacillota bacterium]